MKAKWTPGPWHTGTAEFRSTDAVFGPIDGLTVSVGVIAQCGAVARPREENEANARLIAAAPDLLAALVRLVDTVDQYDGSHAGLDDARAAIALATGEEIPAACG